ncbi:hypothetical protein [Micromonospora sp. NPDC005299]|uniref:hypothetical protein n=1 Tax=Micromonospora sp. NPDC005299 TaxID=3364231 RepID=UPI003677DA49
MVGSTEQVDALVASGASGSVKGFAIEGQGAASPGLSRAGALGASLFPFDHRRTDRAQT